MPVFDTSSTLDTSMYLKANLAKNKVGKNYYIENLQEKRSQDWFMRYNVVDIEEELQKQCEYTKEVPFYTPIEVVIRSVKSEKGQDLGTDWADIAFEDLFHENNIGSRYRFSNDFHKMGDLSKLTEEEKYYNTSIWICINKNPIKAGNNCVIRRCNSSIGMVGSPTLEYSDIEEVHYEPIILENDLKYISFYYNMTTVIPQAEWYATMQCNYFSNCIKINDRVVFGGVDLQDKQNNAVYKVKAIVKASSNTTFQREGSTNIEDIPLVVVAFDKDTIDKSGDNFNIRVAEQAPIYYTKEFIPTYEYYIRLNEPYEKRILLGQTEDYSVDLMWNDEVISNINGEDIEFNITAELLKEEKNYDSTDDEIDEEPIYTPIEGEGKYYTLTINGNNSFSIKNFKTCISGVLRIECACINPLNDKEQIVLSFDLELGGFY